MCVTSEGGDPEVGVVVVSFNRKKLLAECLQALVSQSTPAAKILVVDNGSTDGTQEWLREANWPSSASVELLVLPENTGGAGGFNAGLKRLISQQFDWIWMMDDDARPHPNALEELMRVAVDPGNVYGSLAVKGEDCAWVTTLLGTERRSVDKAMDVPRCSKVQALPFLGFLIHRSLVERIGFPDVGFFIAADDVEYCIRAQSSGAQIFIAGKSLIEHPRSDHYVVRMRSKTLTCLKLPPWKRYYDTRNRLLIAKKYYGIGWVTQTIPGSLVRLIATLLREPRKLAQAWAFFAGFVDGILGIKGKRHQRWGITP